MMAINKQVQILVNTQLDQPQARRVTFSTPSHNIFYMELAMDKTEFIQLHDSKRPKTKMSMIFWPMLIALTNQNRPNLPKLK